MCVCVCVCASVCVLLTCVVQAAVGERQQGGVERTLCVSEDGVVLVDVLHNLRIKLVLLQRQKFI